MDPYEPFGWSKLLIAVAAGGLVIALLIHLIRASYNIRIVVRGGRVMVAGTALTARRAALIAFFAEWLPAVRTARLYGQWDGHRLSVYGWGLSRSDLQRLRNFLLAEL